MTIHLIKLSVGSESVETLAAWQARRLKAEGEIYHTTRMSPRRRDEVLDGGSIYWVIKGFIQARQPILDLREFTDGEGIGRCDIVLDPALVPTHQVPRRPFQGWRYLQLKDAPKDMPGGIVDDGLPQPIRHELREIGVL